MNTRNKIIVRIRGGLGNQLFMYSAARRLSLITNSELVLDHISGFRYDKTYKRTFQLHHFNISGRFATPAERLEPFSRIRRFTLKQVSKFHHFNSSIYIQQYGNRFDQRLMSFSPKANTYIEGYWQSEAYFYDVRTQIRKDLLFKNTPSDDLNLHIYQKIASSTAVAVHVRFFDNGSAKTSEKPANVSPSYYLRASNNLESEVNNPHYFIFSDRPSDVRHLLPLSSKNMTIVSHNTSPESSYADLWLMSHCKHHIIANSTFSWWAAWLCGYDSKIVIAPDVKLTTSENTWPVDSLLSSCHRFIR
jgi:hypothetical protein